MHVFEQTLRTSLSRRSYLQVSAGLGVAWLLPALEGKAAAERGPARASSLITLWLGGGPSQLETWDPHPGTLIGGSTQAIATSVPDLQIASTLPQMAERMQHVSVVRSLVSKEGDHERATYFVKTGYRPDPTVKHPAIGAVIPHQRPSEHLEIPAYVSLVGSQWPGRGGYLGDQFDAFRVFDPGQSLQNLRPRVGETRQQQRLAGLSVVDQAFRRRRAGQVAALQHQQTTDRALEMMSSDQLQAFELSEESEQTRDRYGATAFGRGCLVARRMIETGVRSVEVTLNGFDSHANNFEIQAARAQELDSAFAALLDDLIERDLYDSTIVLCLGEFGRTPRINPLEGRDHWPNGFSAVLGGGRLRSGKILGQTDPEGKKDPVDPVTVQDLYATVLQQLNINPAEELITPIGRPLAICEGSLLPALIAE